MSLLSSAHLYILLITDTLPFTRLLHSLSAPHLSQGSGWKTRSWHLPALSFCSSEFRSSKHSSTPSVLTKTHHICVRPYLIIEQYRSSANKLNSRDRCIGIMSRSGTTREYFEAQLTAFSYIFSIRYWLWPRHPSSRSGIRIRTLWQTNSM